MSHIDFGPKSTFLRFWTKIYLFIKTVITFVFIKLLHRDIKTRNVGHLPIIYQKMKVLSIREVPKKINRKTQLKLKTRYRTQLKTGKGEGGAGGGGEGGGGGGGGGEGGGEGGGGRGNDSAETFVVFFV